MVAPTSQKMKKIAALRALGEGLEPQFLTSTKKHTGATSATEINAQPIVADAVKIFFRSRHKADLSAEDHSRRSLVSIQAHARLGRKTSRMSS